MTSDLTEHQLEHLRFLRSFLDEHGWWPSLREIGARFALRGGKGSTNSATDILQRLQAKQYIYVQPRTARAMRFTAKAWKVFNDET